ncbi:MAG: potassium channel family protein [Acidimicrobiia bacterium]
MPYGSHSTPTPVERWLEARFPGYRFGAVLALLFATFVFMASGVDGAWARVVTVGLQGLTLLAALLASRTGRHLFRLASVVVLLAFISTVASAFYSGSDGMDGVFFLLNVLLVAAAPVVIGRALWRRQVVDIHTVLGAICIYVLIGMLFAFVYASIGLIGDEAFFVQTSSANIADFLYFAFITLTTVGYGDFTAAHGLGRALSSVEALLGQIYLVTVVAVLVSRMAHGVRSPSRDDPDADTPPEPD